MLIVIFRIDRELNLFKRIYGSEKITPAKVKGQSSLFFSAPVTRPHMDNSLL